MTSRDYWKRRSLKLEQLLHSRADETVQAVGRRYQTAQKAISKQVDKVFTAYAKNGALNAETAQRLLSQKETEQARAELMELYQQATGNAKKALWARLSAPAYSARISRLQALVDSIYAQARLVGMDEESLLQARLMDTYEQAYYRTIFDEQQFIGRSFDFTQLDNRQIQAAIAGEWSGDSWSARIWNNNDAFATAVEDTVTVGLLSGLRYDEMQDMLEDVIGTDDTEGARYRSARLIRTECAHVANQGHLMGYKAAGLEYYRFLATLDQRTDEECGKLDMQRFAIDEAEPGVNFPPMHPNCRCTTMPDDSPEELAKIKRFARDPTTGKGTTVPGNMSYQEWCKEYVDNTPTEHSYKQHHGDAEVDLDYINSKAYRQKFMALSDNTELNEAVYQQCKAVVTHQNGTYFEDLAVVSTDGRHIGHTSGVVENETRYTRKLERDIEKELPFTCVSIHNHGSNLPPSGSDLISVGYRQYAFGVVATHDGRVFVYSTRNARAFTRIMFDKTVDKYKTREYNFSVERATERALNDFARDYGLKWREL